MEVLPEKRKRIQEQDVTKEHEKKEKRREIFEKKMKEAEERYRAGGGKKAAAVAAAKKPESYKKVSDMPVETKMGQVYIDTKRETVILPIYGYAVPFHITMIKK